MNRKTNDKKKYWPRAIAIRNAGNAENKDRLPEALLLRKLKVFQDAGREVMNFGEQSSTSG
jgi:hypothetical protein